MCPLHCIITRATKKLQLPFRPIFPLILSWFWKFYVVFCRFALWSWERERKKKGEGKKEKERERERDREREREREREKERERERERKRERERDRERKLSKGLDGFPLVYAAGCRSWPARCRRFRWRSPWWRCS